MEDEDYENGPVNSWTLWEESYNKTFNYSDTYFDGNYREHSSSPSRNGNSNIDLKNFIKSLKNNVLDKTRSYEAGGLAITNCLTALNQKTIENKKNAMSHEKNEMAEYTQYLGLKPTSKSNCKICNKAFNTNLNECMCFSIIQSSQSESPIADQIGQCILPLASSSNDENDELPKLVNDELISLGLNKCTSNVKSSSDISELDYENKELLPTNGSDPSSGSESELFSINYRNGASTEKLSLTGNLDTSIMDDSENILTSPVPIAKTLRNSNFESCSTDCVEIRPTENPELLDTNTSVQSFERESILSSKSSSVTASKTQYLSSQVKPLPQSSNFKTTRKVYLCAACETYFENWNLFLHMRQVHKRHICLFCLGMFGQAERLSHHLVKKHNVVEDTFHSQEEFRRDFKDSCYLMCCLCEEIFSETDNFYGHTCEPRTNQKTSSDFCRMCKQVASHLEMCSLYPGKSSGKHSVQNTFDNLGQHPAISSQIKNCTRRQSKRTIKPSRFNNDVYFYTKLTKKSRTQSLSEAIGISQSTSVSNVQKNEYAESRIVKSFVQDNIDETKKNNSKLEINSGDNQNSTYYNLLQNDSNIDLNELHSCNSDNSTNIYDSTTETIMKVSQCENLLNSTESTKNVLTEVLNCNSDNDFIKSLNKKNEDEIRLETSDQIKEESKDFVRKENSTDRESTSDSESLISNCSQDSNGYKSEHSINGISTEWMEPSLGPDSSGIPMTDRSLIIKICTKNNSVFSISTPSLPKKDSEINENHKSSHEAEGNNNGEVSEIKTSVLEINHIDFLTNDSSSDPKSKKIAIENEEMSNGSHNSYDKEKEPVENLTNDPHKNKNQLREEFDIRNDAVYNEMDTDYNRISLAGEEIPIMNLTINNCLENMNIEELLKICIQAVCDICVYCNHARHIAVNGKELSLHMLSEHRFQPQHPAINYDQNQFTARIKQSLDDLETYYFNLDSYNSKQGTYHIPAVNMYECFHCRFYSSSHKELYLHNRKMHQKPILICIMCKSTFYSYSELICHLCPGVYAANVDIHYRCCLCSIDKFPSAFRLMVHLRKQHHACDVCLESTGNQQRLSNHVWKHKLHHLCYRCGIAYRNKPDITKHLFWKHGTESILCKKCLQKKWPHIYHFCIPPTVFVCEECGYSFSKAVALKVHKRTHSNDFPYSCCKCTEKFVSKKLLSKHSRVHKEFVDLPPITLSSVKANNASVEEVHVDVCNIEPNDDNEEKHENKGTRENGGLDVRVSTEIVLKESVKKVVDVYDLPPLNLSSDSDTEVEEEKEKFSGISNKRTFESDPQIIAKHVTDLIVEVERNEEEKKKEEQIMDGIWDNFKSYTASLEKQDSNMDVEEDEQKRNDNVAFSRNSILADHDYCIQYSDKIKNDKDENPEVSYREVDQSRDMEKKESVEKTPPSSVFNRRNTENSCSKKKLKSPKKKNHQQHGSMSSSGSSSDSDSSYCSCSSDCSCSSSSSSGSSSTSSSSDSNSSISLKNKCNKEVEIVRQKEKEGGAEVSQDVKDKDKVAVRPTEIQPVPIQVEESDLDTTETETDEDFYDEHPQRPTSKLLVEKRKDSQNKEALLKNGVIDNDWPEQETAAVAWSESKRKVKTRKRKKKSVELLKLKISRASISSVRSFGGSGSETDGKRLSKRKRVPKRFYGDSSNDDHQRRQLPKWRRSEEAGVPECEDSSSDSEADRRGPVPPAAKPDRPSSLYCYCQCPYDEVSEMIACDGGDCQIEWFHFECVGITVPPKGKWYCPDCRRRLGIPDDCDNFPNA